MAIDSHPSHVGVCVADLDAALRFYVDGLGFTVFGRYETDDPMAEIDGPVKLTSVFLERQSVRIGLLHFHEPEAFGQPSQRRNQLGLTHLSFVVDDVDAAAAELLSFGGTVVPDSRMGADDPNGLQIVYLADPDGTRIELMRIQAGHDW